MFSYLDADDANHAAAIASIDQTSLRLTHSYVLAELVALCQARRLERVAALDFLVDIVDDADFEIVWVDESFHRSAIKLLQERLDKGYSLCDAVSFILMRSRGLAEALTTDHHFEQEGFVRLLKA